MATKFQNSLTSIPCDEFNGWSISELVGDATFSGLLSLTGDETTEVQSAGSTSWVAVDRYYRVQPGDTVRFSLATGTKG